MTGKLLLAFSAVSVLALASAGEAKDRPSDDRCWQKHKRHWAKNYGPRHFSPYYTPSLAGVRTNYGAPYGGPVTSSPYSATRIVHRQRCARVVG